MKSLQGVTVNYAPTALAPSLFETINCYNKARSISCKSHTILHAKVLRYRHWLVTSTAQGMQEAKVNQRVNKQTSQWQSCNSEQGLL